MSKIYRWILAVNPLTLTSTAATVILTLVYILTYCAHVLRDVVARGLLTLAGVLLLHSAVNLYNDYRDYITGVDLSYRKYHALHRINAIIDLNLSVNSVRNCAIALALTACCIGTYLILTSTLYAYILMAVGLLIGLGYSKYFRKMGLGEVLAGLAVGPFLSIGTYLVTLREHTLEDILNVVLLSIPNGLYTTIILTDIAYARYAVDEAIGKRTIAVILRERTITLLKVLLAICYMSIMLLVALRIVHVLASLLLPLAWLSWTAARRVQVRRLFYHRLVLSCILAMSIVVNKLASGIISVW